MKRCKLVKLLLESFQVQELNIGDSQGCLGAIRYIRTLNIQDQ